jgi:hypothetical protein
LTRPHRLGNAGTPQGLLENTERRRHLDLSNELRHNPQRQMISNHCDSQRTQLLIVSNIGCKPRRLTLPLLGDLRGEYY